MGGNALGLIAAFFSGLGFGIGTVLVRAASTRLSPLANVYVSLAIGTPILLVAAAASGELFTLDADGWILYGFTGLLHYLAGRLLLFYSVEKIGAASAAVSASPSIVLASVLAWVLLGEGVGARLGLAVILISIAVYLAGTKPSGLDTRPEDKMLGLAAGLGSSVVFASTTLIIRYTGLSHGASSAGAFASYLAALLVSTPLIALRKRVMGELRVRDKYMWFMVAAAASVSVAQLLRYNALGLAPVAPVVVFISMNSVYAALLSPFVGSARERPGARHLAAALLAVTALGLAASGS